MVAYETTKATLSLGAEELGDSAWLEVKSLRESNSDEAAIADAKAKASFWA